MFLATRWPGEYARARSFLALLLESDYAEPHMDTECCAIIPARGGSKGVARKNVLQVVGKPLIAHRMTSMSA